MSRLKVWVVVSVVVAFASGGFIGWIVTRLSCMPGSCLPSEIVIGLTSGFVAAFGVGVVIVLADRSMREWREARNRLTDISDEPSPTDSPTS